MHNDFHYTTTVCPECVANPDIVTALGVEYFDLNYRLQSSFLEHLNDHCREHENDPIGQNLAGLLLEMTGLQQASITGYRAALSTAAEGKVSIS